MGSIGPSTVPEVWQAIKKFDGVPRWWAELFVNFGFTSEDAVIWVQTASGDRDSPLSKLREKSLNETLKSYATARGISLLGAGDGESMDSSKADRLIHWVNTITTPEEQEAIIREVGAYADVRFKEGLNGVYTGHAVANAVRSVHQAYQRKAYGADMIILEAGASLKSAVLSGVDPTRYHCCCPVLDVRDSVRHSLRGWLTMVASDESGFKESSRVAARAALDPNGGFVCRCKAQDCTKQVEVICSNESTHDIPFDDLPKVMARHGARLWVGFATRAPGVRRVGGPTSGKCSVFGTRWKLDRNQDKISFHFNKDGSFTYTHKFSEWVSYEEKFGFRWSGKYFDYVYTRLPITTAASLAFVVVRVPKAQVMLKEPVYKASHLSGYVEVTSIRAAGGCVGNVSPTFEPFTFSMETLVFDRVLETRLAQGSRGNLASTMSYMRSVKVRLIVGGTALGAVSSVPVDVLEPAAVAIEVLAADLRASGDRDYTAIIAASSSSSTANILSYFSGLSRWIEHKKNSFKDLLRDALLKHLNGPNAIVVKAHRHSSYVKVDDGAGNAEINEGQVLTPNGCGCNELVAVNAALQTGRALSAVERKELKLYAQQLQKLSELCEVHNQLSAEDASEQFFDAEETTSEVSTVVTSNDSSRVGETDVTSNTSYSDDLCSEVSVYDDDYDSTKESNAIAAMREFSVWAQKSDKCIRTEAAVWADTLFQLGTPTEKDVERSSTARTRHAIVIIRNGRIEQTIGALREGDDFSEIYSLTLRKTCIVYTAASGYKFVKEPLNEICYTSSDLKVMNGDALCRGALQVINGLPRGFKIPRYKYVCGVPGSGKTYEIVQAIVKKIAEGKNVIYLTTTTASQDMVKRDVAKLVGGNDKFVAKTYDSYVINGAVPVDKRTFDMLYLDEVAMAHKGQLFVSIAKSCALDVALYGDPQQLPWLSFMGDFEPKHSLITDEFEREYRTVTHRFGARVCAMWLDVYGSITPCKCHSHTDEVPEVIRITSGSEVPLLPTGKSLTFTQEEKMTLKRELGLADSVQVLKSKDRNGLCTVGEDQGGTHLDVNIVRLTNKKNPKESSQSPSIYNRQPWVLVGTTRHKSKLKYYTVAVDDLVIARFEMAVCPVRYAAIKEGLSWDDVKHKASHVRTFGV